MLSGAQICRIELELFRRQRTVGFSLHIVNLNNTPYGVDEPLLGKEKQLWIIRSGAAISCQELVVKNLL